MIEKKKTYFLPERKPIEFDITYVDTELGGHFEKPPQHIHNECELYIHLGGDVAFMVEDRLYSLEPGSVIITRPGEYHHCVYYSDLHHNYYWILLGANGNEELFSLFFDRPKGHGNKIDLSSAELGEVKRICELLAERELSAIESEAKILKLISVLENGKKATPENVLPHDVALSLSYIKNNLSSQVTVTALAENAFISVNTLERHFAESLKMSPIEYLRRVRLTKAEELLRSDMTVAQISDACGFADYSHFIALFKKHYGLTPLKYKKALRKEKQST